MFTAWMGEPQQIDAADKSGLVFTAGAKTDLFRDPATQDAISNAPFHYRDAPAAFTLTAAVEPAFASSYDAGALLYYVDEEHWTKLAFELTDMGHPAIVSVVTEGRSDDCNGEAIAEERVWLRMSKRDALFGLYYSVDGARWRMHRLLAFPDADGARAGVSAQSPTGSGCTVRFSGIGWSKKAVENVRVGDK